jgi:hypothetical protein
MPDIPHNAERDPRGPTHGSGGTHPSISASTRRSNSTNSFSGAPPLGFFAFLRGTRVFSLAAAVLVAVPLSGCGSRMPTLNTVVVERATEASILTERHLHATVRCPSKVPQRAGFVFTCKANLDVGTYPVLVTETNGSGHVRYQNQAPLVILNIARVEHAITQSILSQRHLSSTVTCPGEVLQQAGIAFTCIATANGRGSPFAVTEVDNNGHVRYIGRR